MQHSGVPMMLSIWMNVIMPKEREGKEWRSTAVLGKKEANFLCGLITRYYLPVLYAVLQKMDEEEIDIWKAADRVEEMRMKYQAYTWEFISELSFAKLDAKAYHTRLLNLQPVSQNL